MSNSNTATLTFRIDPSLKGIAHRSSRGVSFYRELDRGSVCVFCEQRSTAISDPETENKSGARS